MQCFMTDICLFDHCKLSDSSACLSPPLDGSEEISADLMDIIGINDDIKFDKDWRNCYEECAQSKVEMVMNKSKRQAVAAKLNREKKKKYVTELEGCVKTLKENDKTIRDKLKVAEERIDDLEKEISYLKSVLMHDSQLSNLLKNIPSTPGIHLTSVLDEEVKAVKDENQSMKKRTGEPLQQVAVGNQGNVSYKKFRSSDVQAAPGICLHVSERKVTIELCSECTRKATSPNHCSC